MLRVALAALACAGLLCAQTSTTAESNGSSSVPDPARPQGGQPQVSPASQIFLTGTVITDDGSILPRNVAIDSICGPVKRTMARASDNGAFAFRWTTMGSSFGDASQVVRTNGNGAASLTGSRSGSRGLDPLANCELFADAPGYSSSREQLAIR